MCGIAGVFPQISSITASHSMAVSHILEFQHYRGPDFRGSIPFEGCVIGANRLSIVDPSNASHQPFTFNRKHIVFNGEIFNFIQLRNELISLGRRFTSLGDTEVLLQLFDEYGPSCVNRLDGQFAFAIYDERKAELFLARDPFGIKPLYFSIHKRAFYFASSFKALVKVVGFETDITALYEYFSLRYVLSPNTIAGNIHQIEPGHSCTIRKSLSTYDWITHKKYWDIEPERNDCSYKEATEKTQSIINDSIRSQIPLNEPFHVQSAILLSGGLDSSIIAHQIHNHKPYRVTPSFSIDFIGHSSEDNKYATSMATSIGSPLHIRPVGDGSEQCSLTHIAEVMDHPSGARDYLAMFLLSQSVRDESESTKVVFTGTGADELFNGYMNSYFRNLSANVTLDNVENTIADYLNKYSFTSQRSAQLMMGIAWQSKEMKQMLVEKITKKISSLFEHESHVDGVNFHNAFYTRVHLMGWELPVLDETTSHFSMEGRVPFVSKEIAEWSFSLPGSYKYRNSVDKSILRDAYRQSLPESIVNRPKCPFSAQVMSYLDEAVFKDLDSTVKEVALIFGIREEYQQAMNIHDDLFWRVIILDLWFRINLRQSLRDILRRAGIKTSMYKSAF